MSIPIKIALNFAIGLKDSYKKIDSLANNLKRMNDTVFVLKNNFKNFSTEIMGLKFNNFKKLNSDFFKLNALFTDEIIGTFGKTSEVFQNMKRSMEFSKVQKGMETMVNTIKELSGIDIIKNGAGQALEDTFTKIRLEGKIGSDIIEKLTKNFDNLGESITNERDLVYVQKLFEVLNESKKTVSDVEKLNKSIDDMIQKKKAVDSLKNSFQSLFGVMPNGTELLLKLAYRVGAFSAFQDAANAQDRMVRTLSSMGMMAKEGRNELGQLTTSVLKVGTATQIMATDATEAISQLFNMRVVNPRNFADAEELAIMTVRMGQAFDMSTEQAAQFTKSLKIIGGLGVSEIKGAADAVANVQNSLGLTSQEAGEVFTQIGFMTRRMKAFGGTVKNIQVMTTNVAKLSVTFEKAGLAASEANELLNRMLDPTKIEENVLLYQGLGMTVQDGFKMMTGDGQQFNNMSERMIGLAKKLQAQYGQSPLALQAMAEAYGLSLEQVSSLSKMTEKEIALQKEQASLEEQANKAREGMKKSWDRVMASLNIIIQAFIMPLINFITPIIKGFADFVTLISNLIDTLPILGDIIKFVLGALLFTFLLGIGKQILTLIPNIGLLGKAFGGIGNAIAGAAGKFKDFISNALLSTKSGGVLSKIGGFLGGAGKKTPTIPAADTPGPSTTPVPAQKSGFLDQLKGLDPKVLLAIGAAILMIGAAISMVVLSMALLMNVMKGMTAGEIIGGISILVVIMGSFIAMVAILAGVSTAAAAPIAALGGAILMIGGAIALVVASVALLVLSMAFLFTVMKDTVGGEMIAGILTLTNALLMMVAVVGPGFFVMGAALLSLGVIAAATGGLFKDLGANLLNTGTGLKLIADNTNAAISGLTQLKTVIEGFGAFGDAFVESLNNISDAILKLALLSPIMSFTASLMPNVRATQSGGGGDMGAGAPETNQMEILLEEGNKKLDTIANNTKDTVTVLYKIWGKGERRETKINVNGIMQTRG